MPDTQGILMHGAEDLRWEVTGGAFVEGLDAVCDALGAAGTRIAAITSYFVNLGS